MIEVRKFRALCDERFFRSKVRMTGVSQKSKA